MCVLFYSDHGRKPSAEHQEGRGVMKHSHIECHKRICDGIKTRLLTFFWQSHCSRIQVGVLFRWPRDVNDQEARYTTYTLLVLMYLLETISTKDTEHVQNSYCPLYLYLLQLTARSADDTADVVCHLSSHTVTCHTLHISPCQLCAPISPDSTGRRQLRREIWIQNFFLRYVSNENKLQVEHLIIECFWCFWWL